VRSLDKMFNSAVRFILVLSLAGEFLPGCGQIKDAGRTIGHTARDVTKEIGHGAREITKEIGHGTRDVAREVGEGARDATQDATEEVKKVGKPAPAPSEY